MPKPAFAATASRFTAVAPARCSLALDDRAALRQRLVVLLRLEPLPHLGPGAVAVFAAGADDYVLLFRAGIVDLESDPCLGVLLVRLADFGVATKASVSPRVRISAPADRRGRRGGCDCRRPDEANP